MIIRKDLVEIKIGDLMNKTYENNKKQNSRKQQKIKTNKNKEHKK